MKPALSKASSGHVFITEYDEDVFVLERHTAV